MKLRSALLASLTLLALTGCPEEGDDKDDGDGDTDVDTDVGTDDDTDDGTDTEVDEDGDGSPAGEDCDDSDPDVNPSADEICDGIDNDCDELIDAEDDSITDLGTFYTDADGDSYGDLDAPVEACGESAGVVADSTDCDDANSDINPAAEEICDAVDNDCDGTVNGETATDATDWYPDADSDGYGDSAATPVRDCDAPSGTVGDATDCDDAKDDVNPGATEVWYDGVDSDCDGLSDYDADGDGEDVIDATTGTGTDCDDTDATVNTAATDTWYDGVDSNCDGLSDYDADADGYDSSEYEGLDCDDADAAVNPDAVDIWYDGVDDDCSGGSDYDADGDGYDSDAYSGTDCDDDDAGTFPYALELSTDTDGLDNDCDGTVDAADTDAVDLDGGDDTVDLVTLSGFTFPFCGSDYSEFEASSNGRIIFDDSDGADFSESASEFAGATNIAVFWDDMNVGSSYSTGGLYKVEFADAVGIYWWDVVRYGGTSAADLQRFSILMFDDGSMMMNHDTITQNDGIVGFSCAPGSYSDESDISAAVANAGSLGLGDGTEDLYFEQWGYSVVGGSATYDSSEVFDLGGWLPLCGLGGDDADGDGYTTECGDPDDADPTITP